MSQLQQQLESDNQGRQLFDDLSISEGNPFENLDLSSQNKPHQIHEEDKQKQQQNDQFDLKAMMRNSKMDKSKSKKQRKKQKKMRKIKEARSKHSHKKQNLDQNISPSNKKQGKKMTFDSQQQNQQNHSNNQVALNKKQSSKKRKNSDQDVNDKSLDENSDEYSSEKNISSSESQGLANLNPNQIQQQGSGRKLKKRLGKKSRKMRIMQKQGFDLRQLGNDGDANYQKNQSEDDSEFSNKNKKNKSNKKMKKQKKQLLTNEQMFDKLNQIGCQQQVDENQSQRYNYDSGIDQVQRIKSKKQSKNTIKVQNKLFGDIQMELQKQINSMQPQGEQEVPTEKLELQFKPKSSISLSRTGSFLNKVEAMKKNRGLEAQVDLQQFQKMTKQKAKRSLSHLVSKIQFQVQQNQEIDIQIKAPTIAKGKSGDLINNTMFIARSFSQKQQQTTNNQMNNLKDGIHQNNDSKLNLSISVDQKGIQKITTNLNSNSGIQPKNKKGVSRGQFFRQIKQSINVRRSKYVSAEELKNSFKASKLQELEQIRKKIETKRKKDAMYELGQVDDDDAENVINQLEEELARKGGMSKEDLRKLLRAEQGLQQLGEYQDQEQNSNKKKKNINSNVSEEKKQKQQQNKEQKNIRQIVNEKDMQVKKGSQIQVKIAIKLQKNKPQRETKLNKQQNSGQMKGSNQVGQQIVQMNEQKYQNQMHQDDMIESYEGEEQNAEMDLQNEQQQQEIDEEIEDLEQAEQSNNDSAIDNQIDDQQNQNQVQEEEEDQRKSQQKQSLNQMELQNKQPAQTLQIRQKQNLQKQGLMKQLEDEGIIMPGTYKRKPLISNGIDLNNYIAQNQVKNTAYNPFKQTLDMNSNQSKKLIEKSQQNLSTKDETLQFKQFKKLRKIAVVIQQKKKKRQQQLKRAKDYFEQQAQLGSDNQQNDDNVKAINKKSQEDEYDGDDLDVELEELIDNAVDINEANEEEAFKKYMEDVKQKDRQELQRILRGDFRRPNHEQLPEMAQMQEDQKNRNQRMQKMFDWMKKRQDDQKGMYVNQQEDDQMNYYYDYNGTRKKIAGKKQKNTKQDDGQQETPSENEQQVQRKLQNYLMDNISPAKRDTDIQLNSDLVLELPNMIKKVSRPFIGNFGIKNDFSQMNFNENPQNKKFKSSSNIYSFTGGLLNLAAKYDKQKTGTPTKPKRTSSHMSDELNKNKSQKQQPYQQTKTKLPSIFGRVVSTKK